MKKIVVLSGAGVSAESGLKTFRDADGLWEGHDVMEVASPEGWYKNPELVLDFYNQRRAQLKEVAPNLAHQLISRLEQQFHVDIVTQNVDDLHERGGSSNVTHLHGELLKVRSVYDPTLIYTWQKDLMLGDLAEDGEQLRPHIVWFGEDVPLIPRAIKIISTADIVIIIGTSMQVYPAAGLIAYAPKTSQVYYIDPKPAINIELRLKQNLIVLDKMATVGMMDLYETLLSNV